MQPRAAGFHLRKQSYCSESWCDCTQNTAVDTARQPQCHHILPVLHIKVGDHRKVQVGSYLAQNSSTKQSQCEVRIRYSGFY